jgi:thymidine phosphorylase
MVETGEHVGKKMVALITDMNQPLGTHVGNSLEVIEALDVLRGEGPDDLRQLCLELASWMFFLGGIESTTELGKMKAERLIRSGAALETFRTMLKLQGGDEHVVDDASLLPSSKQTRQISSLKTGFVAETDCQAIGTASVILGGGRAKKEDSVDPSVGIILHRKLGDAVSAGEPLYTIHYNSETQASEAALLLQKSFRIAEAAPTDRKPLIHRVILGAAGVSPVLHS